MAITRARAPSTPCHSTRGRASCFCSVAIRLLEAPRDSATIYGAHFVCAPSTAAHNVLVRRSFSISSTFPLWTWLSGCNNAFNNGAGNVYGAIGVGVRCFDWLFVHFRAGGHQFAGRSHSIRICVRRQQKVLSLRWQGLQWRYILCVSCMFLWELTEAFRWRLIVFSHSQPLLVSTRVLPS